MGFKLQTIILASPPSGTHLTSAPGASDSALFFSLSLTIFALVGVVIFIRRCVRCPPPAAEGRYPPNAEPAKPPSPIHTLYSATSDNLQIPFPSFVFKEGGSTPNLQMNAELTSVASRECMTSPELNYNQNAITPDTPRSFDISHSASNFFPFPSPYSHTFPCRGTIYAMDTPFGGSSVFPSVNGQSNFTYDGGRDIPSFCSRKFDDPNLSSTRLNQIHLNLISSSPSLFQTSPRSSLALSPSRSNFSVESEVTCSAYDDDEGQNRI